MPGWFKVSHDGKSFLIRSLFCFLFPAEPHILNLSVVEMPCGSDSAPRRLQCQAEGNPPPKIAWLSASRRMLENKGESSQSSPYHVTSCVPYLEEEELTCRAESALNHTERTYPTREPQDQSEESEESEESDSLKIPLIVCAVIALLILIAGIVFYCLSELLFHFSTAAVVHILRLIFRFFPPLSRLFCLKGAIIHSRSHSLQLMKKNFRHFIQWLRRPTPLPVSVFHPSSSTYPRLDRGAGAVCRRSNTGYIFTN